LENLPRQHLKNISTFSAISTVIVEHGMPLFYICWRYLTMYNYKSYTTCL